MDQAAEEASLARGTLAGSEEALLAPAGPPRDSNSRALKIAGLTTLACLLLASQVFTAIMVFDQKQQIHSLQKNSDRLGKQMARSSQASTMRKSGPIISPPLFMNFVVDSDATATKTPLTKLQDTAVSVETQLKEFMQDSQLPHFNETFLVNLQSLKQRMNESEWKSFDSWMRYWLIFQMAQKSPPPPTPESAPVIKTKCQTEAELQFTMIGHYKPQCDEEGNYKPMQCWYPTGYCWCVDSTGAVIEGTQTHGRPDCRRAYPIHRMAAPMLAQIQTLSSNDEKSK